MTAKIKCWTIALVKDVNGPKNPEFFYNHVKDAWVRKFTIGCAFPTRELAFERLGKLGLDAEIFAGHISQ